MLKMNNYVKNTAVGTFIGLAAWGIIETASGAVYAAYLKYKMKKALQEEAEN